MLISRSSSAILSSLVASSLLSLAACGGGGQESSGAGGAGGSSSSETASTGSTNPSVSGPEACADVCHKFETNGCKDSPGDCTAVCEERFNEAGQCADALGKLFVCWLPLAEDCSNNPPPGCKAEEDSFEACNAAYGCGPSDCSGSSPDPNGNAVCGCSQTCAMKEYETSCKIQGSMATCDCSVDGAMVGTCQDSADLACGIDDGCCADIFKKK